MRTNFTLEDAKRLIETIYNGNMAKFRATKGAIPYENENSETIMLYDEYGNKIGERDLAQYLNLHFYTWRNRVVDSEDGRKIPVDAWVQSLEESINDAYALVELTNVTSVASQDIDSATVTGRVTIIIQANKAANLDYYASKIRNTYLGDPQDYTNSIGDDLKMYHNLGIVLYDEEPSTMQLGECVTVSFNFTINYLNTAYSYKDIDISFSLGVDPDELAENPFGYKYNKLPITKASFVSQFTYEANPLVAHPDRAGVVNNALSTSWTIAFFDFKQPFMEELNHLFWEFGATKIKVGANGEWSNTTLADLNMPVFIKVKVPFSDMEYTYKYQFVITEMRKEVVNGDFTVCALSLKSRSMDDTPFDEVTE